MGTGSLITTLGRVVALNRTFKGTPDYLAPSQFAVGTGTTTPTTADPGLGTPIQISGADYKDVDSGYPDATTNESILRATTRCTVDTTECNGESITEFGLFNKDGTPKCFSHMVHTAVAKTSSVQLIYTETDRVS